MTKPSTLFEISKEARREWTKLLGWDKLMKDSEIKAHFPPFDPKSETEKFVGMTKKSIVNYKQVGGDHYKTAVIEPWDYCLANGLGYLESSAIKYITRWKKKGGIKDIEKAVHYLEKLIEWETRHDQNRS